MRTRLALLLVLSALTATAAVAQEAREGADRALKGALGGNELSDDQTGAAFGIVHEFLKGQARLCERRKGPRNEEEIDWLVSELLAQRLAEADVPLSAQRPILGVAFGRLTELVETAGRRDSGEAGLKTALEGSSLTEAELPVAHADLVADAEAAGPSLLRRADELAAEENAKALPGQEVEPDPIALVIEHLAERFDGRGLSSGEFEAMAEPYTMLMTARRDMLDAARFAKRSGGGR